MRRRLLVVLAGLALSATLGSPAGAHGTDPQVVTVLDHVAPALAPGVVVQVQSSVAEQLVAQNPTGTDLVVLASGGEPFLRVSRHGVFANVASPDWYTSNSPLGVVRLPAGVRSEPGGAPRWVQVSRGDSWGWFDHRLHATQVVVPAAVRAAGRRARLFDWAVPMRYGDRAVRVSGHVEFRPILGQFVAVAQAHPAGVQVSVGSGRVPAILLDPGGHVVTVTGRDGLPFARLTPTGVEVNTGSATYRDDRQLRGASVPAEAASPGPHFVEVTTARSYTWLDTRLRYPHDLPPRRVLAAGRAQVVAHWSVPVTVDGAAAQLRGVVRWVPAAVPPGSRKASGGSFGLPVGVLVAGAVLAGGVALTVVGRRRGGTRRR